MKLSESSKTFGKFYVPGFLADSIEVLSREQAVIKWLKAQYDQGATITAACNGNLFIGFGQKSATETCC